MLVNALTSQRSLLSRAIGALLVLFIFYGTTVEASHKHSNVLVSTDKYSSVSEADSGDGSIARKSGCSECLICQLHQNFTATLLTSRPLATQLNVQKLVSRLETVVIHSHASRPHSGRAPPLAN